MSVVLFHNLRGCHPTHYSINKKRDEEKEEEEERVSVRAPGDEEASSRFPGEIIIFY